MIASKQPLVSLLKSYYKKYRRAVWIGSFTIIAVDVAELFIPWLLKRVMDAAVAGDVRSVLAEVLWGLSLALAVQVVGRYVWRVTLAQASMKGGADIREAFSDQIFRVPMEFFDRKQVGELMNTATGDVENMRMALGPGLIGLIDALFYCVSIPIAMLLLEPQVTGIVLLPMMLIPWVVIYLQRHLGERSRQVQIKLGELSTLTQEAVAGVRVAKVSCAEEQIQGRLNGVSQELNHRQVAMSKIQVGLGPALEFFLSVSMVLLFAGSQGLSVGTLVALQRYLQKLMWPMSAIGMSMVYFQKAIASGRTYYEFLEEKIREDIVPLPLLAEPKITSNSALIEVNQLSFQYPNTQQGIQNFSFSVHPGEWLGIFGPMGSGKSTLLSLLLGFYPVQPGKIKVAGRDLVEWPIHDLRQWFSPVLQDPYLFQGSIRNNLEDWDRLPLEQALRWSEVYDNLAERRMDESMGDKGAGLSGGQKQRLAIARALRKDAPIFLLDDPLSSVDSKTAGQVLERLSRELRSRHKTVIFVSHRPEHLAYCDRVIEVGR